ncbi:NUC189-domain-containing protein [Testicularia cyperi]|uniref:NUC189-domain-containing protein n=1 Tax=Testicularia cyperi TaxID=1882483 RepID=A0A317XRS3_9BASI|nr:NUC189-domain-containing protein [Testicularia cyperi]
MVKNKAPKPSKSRPVSTSELNQPLLPSAGAATASTASCSFSPAPDHDLFAHISNQVHQQRLRIYNASAAAASTSQLVTDFLLNSLGDAACLSSRWVRLQTKAGKSAKRRKHDGASADDAASSSSQLLLALGLSSGRIHLLNPALAQSVAVLDASSAAGSSSSSSTNAGIVSLAFSESSRTLFACSKNGWISSFSLADLKLGADVTPARPSSSFRPDAKSAVQLIAAQDSLVLSAHHSISLTDAASASSSTDAKPRTSFTGHASPVTHLEWVSKNSFVSAGDGDRVVSVWSFDDKTTSGRATATAALDGPVRALSVQRASKTTPRTLITIITQTGSVRVYGLPTDGAGTSSDASPSKRKGAVLPALELLATSSADDTSSAAASGAEYIDARLVADQLRLARLIRGAKVSIESVTVADAKSGGLRKSIALPKTGSKLASSDGGVLSADASEAQLTGGSAPTQRFADAPMRPQGLDDAEIATSLEEAGIVSSASKGADAEPSLAQRLRALGFNDPSMGLDEDEDVDMLTSKKQQGGVMTEASLASSLSQALHSGDTSLLTSCLNHNDPVLIRNTVRKISGPLSVRLLEECVSRLNGVGGSHVSRGSMGSQKARGLMEWVRATLLNHMGYLMSLPNLVSRLSGLHATLSSRLATHERLLALNGRLELVLSQIEARAAYMAQAKSNQIQVQGVKFGGKGNGKATSVSAKRSALDESSRREGKKWVEDSDDDDDSQDGMDVDEDGVLVRGEDDEEGDVQNIALGADDSDDDDDDDDEDDDVITIKRRRARNGRMSDGNTSADSDEEDDDEEEEETAELGGSDDEDDEEDDIEEIEDEDEDDEEEEDDESELEGEGASDMEDDEEEEYDEEDEGRGGANGMFDLEAEEGTDEDDEE